MFKRLRLFYRLLFGPRRALRLSAQTVSMMAISVAFLATLYTTAPFARVEPIERSHKHEAQATAVAAQAAPTTSPYPYPAPAAAPTRTPLPPEYLQTENQSNGITLAAAILVMIVVFGALAFIPRREEE